ncbi:hypothetical protein B296_00047881 [Ensete ventricosum]|uniref:Uncharacterized protein n=1 Tax=Ensete ventricosum TaxID=4639 RepID=A0A426XI10_ENSVE|nr:hypothetical protein B296_00047881 [Ensete ventricosum]
MRKCKRVVNEKKGGLSTCEKRLDHGTRGMDLRESAALNGWVGGKRSTAPRVSIRLGLIDDTERGKVGLNKTGRGVEAGEGGPLALGIAAGNASLFDPVLVLQDVDPVLEPNVGTVDVAVSPGADNRRRFNSLQQSGKTGFRCLDGADPVPSVTWSRDRRRLKGRWASDEHVRWRRVREFAGGGEESIETEDHRRWFRGLAEK